jgi:hypothetical protein
MDNDKDQNVIEFQAARDFGVGNEWGKSRTWVAGRALIDFSFTPEEISGAGHTVIARSSLAEYKTVVMTGEQWNAFRSRLIRAMR